MGGGRAVRQVRRCGVDAREMLPRAAQATSPPATAPPCQRAAGVGRWAWQPRMNVSPRPLVIYGTDSAEGLRGRDHEQQSRWLLRPRSTSLSTTPTRPTPPQQRHRGLATASSASSTERMANGAPWSTRSLVLRYSPGRRELLGAVVPDEAPSHDHQDRQLRERHAEDRHPGGVRRTGIST